MNKKCGEACENEAVVWIDIGDILAFCPEHIGCENFKHGLKMAKADTKKQLSE